MDFGRPVVIGVGLALGLAACTPGDVVRARDTARATVLEPAVQLVQETHQRRRDVRQELYELEDEVFDACKMRVRQANLDNNLDEAMTRLQACFDILEEAYPALVTVQGIELGLDSIDRLRNRGEEAPAE